jgi:hypothetical protein
MQREQSPLLGTGLRDRFDDRVASLLFGRCRFMWFLHFNRI